MAKHHYFALNKPYNMVSQFISSHSVRLLGDLDIEFPEGIHAVGRLDQRSEGLLLLTTDKRITRLLFQSRTPHKRVYLALLKYQVSQATLQELRAGVSITVAAGESYFARPTELELVDDPGLMFGAPLESSRFYSGSWIRITLTEGKFHQVRKMIAAVGHRCLRLVRVSIEDLELGSLQPGMVKEFSKEEFFRQLKISC